MKAIYLAVLATGLGIFLVAHAQAQHELQYELQLNRVPAGDVSVRFDFLDALSVSGLNLSNSTTLSSTSADVSSYMDFASASRTRNIVDSGGSNSAGTGLFIDDVITINGDNPGTNATIKVELNVSGTFDLEGGMIPGNGEDPVFDADCTLFTRFDSPRFIATGEATANLRDIIDADGGARPRFENRIYPFDVTAVVTALITVGEPFSVDFNFTSYADVTFAEVPDIDINAFTTIDDLNSLTTTSTGQIRCITINNDVIQNPTITSASGTDYNRLLNKPEIFRISSIDYDSTSRVLDIEWESPSSLETYQIRQSTDLKTWTLLSGNISRLGSKTTRTITLPANVSGESYFRVEAE